MYPYVPPNILDIPCKQTARYVIVETTYDAPEDNPTRGAILEICEIEVDGMYVYKRSDNIIKNLIFMYNPTCTSKLFVFKDIISRNYFHPVV